MTRLERVAEQEELLKDVPIHFHAFLKKHAEDYVKAKYKTTGDNLRDDMYIEKLGDMISEISPCIRNTQLEWLELGQ